MSLTQHGKKKSKKKIVANHALSFSFLKKELELHTSTKETEEEKSFLTRKMTKSNMFVCWHQHDCQCKLAVGHQSKSMNMVGPF